MSHDNQFAATGMQFVTFGGFCTRHNKIDAVDKAAMYEPLTATLTELI